MNWTLICTIVGTLIALATFALLAWSQAKGVETQRQQQISDAVAAAVAPITADRDYWRQRADVAMDELRRRNDADRSP